MKYKTLGMPWALQRLKPPPRRASNRRKNVRAKKGEDKGVEVEDPDDKAEKDKQFNLLTEAAAELISLGYEDIYQDNKDKIAANLHTDVDQGASRGGVVWHDDGTVRDEAAKEHAMYQRSTDNAALNYQESAPVASVETDQPAAASHQTQIPTPLSGLGDSREFSGGPVNFERPKYRHSPYGLPPVRPSGRFAPELGRSSPRGRGSPTGRSFGRGFSEPPRSSIMRPQYSQQPPAHMSHGVFLPQQYGGYSPQPLPPNYQHQAPYYPPQQPYPAPPQQGYPQYSGQQPYPPLQQQYPPQPYAQPPQYDAQAPQYDAQWQQYQQYSAYPQPAAYPPPAAAPPE
ncbi:hypothetical protein WJX79_006378 [Trebouxia sp. C0005]